MTTIENFPDVSYASEDGLLALGGDLSAERLLVAYRKGIFPWYNPGEPILWWSPNPRCVIVPKKFRPSKSLRKSIRKQGFKFTVDQAFDDVIRQCAAPRVVRGSGAAPDSCDRTRFWNPKKPRHPRHPRHHQPA